MTTTTQANALALARALLGILNDPQLCAVHNWRGWQLDDETLRRIKEEDDARMLGQWVAITEIATEARVSFQTSHEPGRVVISATYPKDWEPYIEGRGRAWRESITVSATKSPAQIAADMQRRLFSATGYFEHLRQCIAARTKSEQAQAAAESNARALRAIFGVQPERAWQSEPTPEQLRRVHVYRPAGIRVDAKVEMGGARVDLKLEDLTFDEARAICELVRDWNDGRSIQEPQP